MKAAAREPSSSFAPLAAKMKCYFRIQETHKEVYAVLQRRRKCSLWCNNINYYSSTQSKQKWKVIDKISQGFRLCGVLGWLFPHHPLLELSLGNYIRARYGNPDCQNLGTLKNKIQIHGFLSFLSNNMRSNFIFRVAIYL